MVTRHAAAALVAIALSGCARPPDSAPATAPQSTVAPTANTTGLDAMEAAIRHAPTDHPQADAYRDAARHAGMFQRPVVFFEALARDSQYAGLADVHYQFGMALIDLLAHLPGAAKGMLASRAVEAFDDAIERQPANWDAEYARALVFLYIPGDYGAPARAIAEFERLVARQKEWTSHPGFAQAYVGLGDAYAHAGDAIKAKAAWTEGAKQFPASTMLQDRLASGVPGSR